MTEEHAKNLYRAFQTQGFGRVNDTIAHSKAAEAAVTALARTDTKLMITGNGMIWG